MSGGRDSCVQGNPVECVPGFLVLYTVPQPIIQSRHRRLLAEQRRAQASIDSRRGLRAETWRIEALSSLFRRRAGRQTTVREVTRQSRMGSTQPTMSGLNARRAAREVDHNQHGAARARSRTGGAGSRRAASRGHCRSSGGALSSVAKRGLLPSPGALEQAPVLPTYTWNKERSDGVTVPRTRSRAPLAMRASTVIRWSLCI